MARVVSLLFSALFCSMLTAAPVTVIGGGTFGSDWPAYGTYGSVYLYGSEDATTISISYSGLTGGSWGSTVGSSGGGVASINQIVSSWFSFSVYGESGYLKLFSSRDYGSPLLAEADLRGYAAYGPKISYGYDWEQQVTIVATPEPGTFVIAGIGLFLGGMCRRLLRKQSPCYV